MGGLRSSSHKWGAMPSSAAALSGLLNAPSQCCPARVTPSVGAAGCIEVREAQVGAADGAPLTWSCSLRASSMPLSASSRRAACSTAVAASLSPLLLYPLPPPPPPLLVPPWPEPLPWPPLLGGHRLPAAATVLEMACLRMRTSPRACVYVACMWVCWSACLPPPPPEGDSERQQQCSWASKAGELN